MFAKGIRYVCMFRVFSISSWIHKVAIDSLSQYFNYFFRTVITFFHPKEGIKKKRAIINLNEDFAATLKSRTAQLPDLARLFLFQSRSIEMKDRNRNNRVSLETGRLGKLFSSPVFSLLWWRECGVVLLFKIIK